MKRVSSINSFFKRSTNGTNSSSNLNGSSNSNSSTNVNNGSNSNGGTPGSQTPPNLSNIEYEQDDHVFSPAKLHQHLTTHEKATTTTSTTTVSAQAATIGLETTHHPLESSLGSSNSGFSIFSPHTSPTSTPTLTRHIVEQYTPSSNINNNSNTTTTSTNNENKLIIPSSSSSSPSSSSSVVNTTTTNNNNNNNVPEIIKSALIISTETVSPDRKPFTIYKVQVETNKTIYIIWRRYSEFLDIDLKLRAAYPLSRLPFPPKKTFGKMNNEFIEQRKDHLQQFVNALFTHPTLVNLPSDPIVSHFLRQSSTDKNQMEVNINLHQSRLANDQVVRYIISTLPFWSEYLDYRSLLSLTETCVYLLNTVSLYSDLWRQHYWDLYSILHFGTNRQCVCAIDLNNYLQERSNGLKRENSANMIVPSPSNSSSSPSNPFINIISGRKNHNKQKSQDSTTSACSSISSSPTTIVGSHSSNDINQLSISGGAINNQQNNHHNSHRDMIVSSQQSTTSASSLVETMEYSRQVFIKLLSTHYRIRTCPESHRAQGECDCDCLAPKFRGTIIGIPNITGSFLQSFNTEFQARSSNNSLNRTISSIDLNSSRDLNQSSETSSISSLINNNNNNSEDSNNNNCSNSMISHIVSNGRMLCVTTSDSSNLCVDELRYNLSLCHFVLLAFSLIDILSFESIGVWVEEIKMICPEAPIVLVGLQRDLREELGNKQSSISYQQGLDQSKQIQGCVAYIESPSASDGVGGWRRSLLSELASQLINHYREVFVQHATKKSNYSVRGSFLSKIFPRYPEDTILKGLTSYDGDVEKALELLALDYNNFIESDSSSSTTSSSNNRKSFHMRSQSIDSTSKSSTNLNPWIQGGSNGSSSISQEMADSSGKPSSPPPQALLRQSVKIPESQINSLVEKLKKNSVDSFIKGFLRKKNLSQDQQAEMVLSFLREMRTQLQSSQLFSSLNVQNPDQEEDLTSLPLGEIENYLYQNIYKAVFSTQESLEKDVILSDRMGKLLFVEPQHLEINQIHWNKDLWLAAEKELHSVNDLYSPSQKLECILNCCKIILFLLSNSDSPGGADDFLPHLIYVVIHANVPNLFSNFEFTSKFCNSELLKMERYYYFTTFGIAVTFIEGIDSKHLKIDPEEYEAYMSGKKKYNPHEQQQQDEKAAISESSRAKIMQKLGIDETTANVAITSPTKKKNNVNGEDQSLSSITDDKLNIIDDSFEKAISQEKRQSSMELSARTISSSFNEKENPFNSPSASDGPLLPIQWANTAPSDNNKRNSVKGMSMSRTPSPPDTSKSSLASAVSTTTTSLQVEEHPLSFAVSKKDSSSSTTTTNATATTATTSSSSIISLSTTTSSSNSNTIDSEVTDHSITTASQLIDNNNDNIDNPLDLNHNVIIDQ